MTRQLTKMTLTIHVWIHKRDLIDTICYVGIVYIMRERPQSTPSMSYVNNITSSPCVIELRPNLGDNRDHVPATVTILHFTVTRTAASHTPPRSRSLWHPPSVFMCIVVAISPLTFPALYPSPGTRFNASCDRSTTVLFDYQN